MSGSIPDREVVELAFLFLLGAVLGAASLFSMDRVPYVAFPFNLNLLVWSLFFILLGLFPVTLYLFESRQVRVVTTTLLVSGLVGAVVAPQAGVVSEVVYLDGMNVLLFLLVALGSVPVALYANRAEELVLASIVVLTLVIYLFVLAYHVLAFLEVGDAVVFVSLLGATFVSAAVVLTYWYEYRRTGMWEVGA